MNLAPSNDRRGRGFTLIELLLAMVIFSIVLVAINMVFYSALRLRNKTAAVFEEALPLQRTLSVMKHDLANLVVPGGILSGTLQSTLAGTAQSTQTSSSSSSGQSQSVLGSAQTMIPIAGALESSPFFFTSTGRISDTVPWADIQQVCYILMQPTNNTPGKSLVRCVTRNLLPVSSPDAPDREWLLNGVQDLLFFYYDGLQWQNVWDTTQTTNTLPLAIKVQILLLPEPGQRQAASPIELVVPVDLQTRTNQTTQSTSTGGTS
jgi:prepilin-type N-terminal cleavage/methylation domain-containing protein